MKVFISLLPLLASCFAGETGYNSANQKGLLVLPKPAPAGSSSYEQNQAQYVTKNYYNQQPQTPEILRPEFAERRGVYFVEVPQERIQALEGYTQQQVAPKSTQNFQTSLEDSSPVNVRYLPLEATSSQYRQEAPEEAVLRYLAVPLTEQSGQYGRQYDGQEQRQAVVQHSQVLPISGPVYSYSPRALTRILRGAPVY